MIKAVGHLVSLNKYDIFYLTTVILPKENKRGSKNKMTKYRTGKRDLYMIMWLEDNANLLKY